MWRKVYDWFQWLFPSDARGNAGSDCPTCGEPIGPGHCGDEGTCEEIVDDSDLRARFAYIYTKNKYLPTQRKPKKLCDPAGKVDHLTITGNRCKYKGEIRKMGDAIQVCLECDGCNGGGSSSSGNIGLSIKNTLGSIPDGKCMYDGSCPEIECGYWYNVNKARRIIPQPIFEVSGRSRRNRNQNQSQSLISAPPGSSGSGTQPSDEPCTPELIYDDSGCKVIGIKPVLLSRGTLAYWESTHVYPLTKRCDGTPLYGKDDAGKPIRHHKTPNRALEPHYLSRQSGVVSYVDPGNKEWGNTYARFIQFEFKNIKLPTNTAKPLNENVPLTIMIMPRTDAQKSVRGSGIFVNTFKTNIHGEEFAVPKNGANSVEYFDVNTYYGGNDTHRGGENMDKFAMVFHSPDMEFDRPALDADSIKLELNMFGKGMQYGNCAEGIEPDSPFVGRENQKGVRASISLNNFVAAEGDDKAVNRCVKALSYVPAHSVVDKGDDFTYPLMNLYRESSVYVEAEGNIRRLRRTLNSGNISEKNNGHPGRPTGFDGTSDMSLLGSHLWHDRPIHDASLYYGNLKTYLPSQYGGLVNATYIDFYPLTKEELKQDVIGINNGDSFINMHSIVRKSFVSDKIMEDISPALPGGGIFGDRAGFMGGLLRRIFNDAGHEECGNCPESGDPTDPRNGINKQALRDSFVDGPWDGLSSPPLATGSDIFFPHLQKTQLIFAVESDVNLYYRATGDPDAGEVHYVHDKLKKWNLDSEFPKGSKWEEGFLNRFYIEMNENPRWKMILRVVVNLLFTYGIGVYLILKGIGDAVNSGSQISVGFVINLGGLPGAILNILVAVLGMGWIIFWSNNDHDNKFWDRVLGISGCWPDITGRVNEIGSRWRSRIGRAIQFEDNHFNYNWDYSKQNTASATLGLPDPYSTCDCEGDTTFELLYSNQQNPLSPTDAYRNFKVNSFLLIPSHSGKLKKMFRLGNRVFVQTTDAMFSLQTGASELKAGDRAIYLEAATALQVPVEIFGGTEEGRGGTTDPNAGRVTKWGYLYPDSEQRTWNLFNGQGNVILGDFGMSKFLDNFMAFNDTDRLRDEKTLEGIGYSVGVDNGKGMVHITKRDWDKDKNSMHWTLTFDMENRAWVGFEYFAPVLYVWDRFKMYSMNKGTMWQHGKPGEFLTVYGESRPMIVDFVIKDWETLDAWAWHNSKIDVEFDEWQDVGFISKNEMFFTEIGAYNSYQSSGLMPVEHHDDMNAIEQLERDPSRLPVANLHRRWQFNKLIDKVETQGVRLFSTWREDIFTDFKDGALSEEGTDNRFIDNHMVMRLVYEGSSDVRVYLKAVITKANSEIG